MLTQAQKHERYGKVGSCKNLVRRKLPYPLYVTVGRDVYKWTKIWVHKDIADNLIAALECVLHEYGLKEIKRLGLDICGGCFNDRKMRGSKNKWSSHAWGIAIDFLPKLNALRMTWEQSAFSKPEYQRFVEIFYEHNFINYGKEKNYDSMHFEIKD